MERISRFLICLFISLLLINPKDSYAFYYTNKKVIALNNREPEIDPVKFQQMKAQIHLFKQVLDEFGASSPREAAELWAKSKSERNGVYEYAVSCDELKQKLLQKWGKAEDNYWNLETSSPWTNKYEIVKNQKVNENTYRITLKFHWFTSAGEEKPTYDTLTIIKGKKYWCVKDDKTLE